MERPNPYDEAMGALRKLRHCVRLDPKIGGWVRDAERAVERLQDDLNMAEQHADYLECELRGRKLWPLPADPGMQLYPLPEVSR